MMQAEQAGEQVQEHGEVAEGDEEMEVGSDGTRARTFYQGSS